MTDRFTEARVAALAAGELAGSEAAAVRGELARDPSLARRYGELRGIHRALADFAAAAPPAPAGLEDRVLAATLPRFRRLYGRRTAYWPTWLAAAAALLVVGIVQPGPVSDLAASFPRASEAISGLQRAATRHTGRARQNLDVLRASMGVAFEDRMDQLGDRIRDFERVTRGPEDRGDPGFADPGAADPGPPEGVAP